MSRRIRSCTLHSLSSFEGEEGCEERIPVTSHPFSTSFGRKPRSRSQNDLSDFVFEQKLKSRSSSKIQVSREDNPLLFGKKVIPGEGIYEGTLSFDGVRIGKGCMKGFRDFKGGCHFNSRGKKALKYQYDGQWENDLQHGFGTHKFFDSGDRFEGNFARGKREGKGLFLWGNGDKYTGNFENGLMHGLGRFECANGDVYHGMWREGKMMGEGYMINGDGSECQGNFRDGQLHGWARKVWSHGDSFEGYFNQDLMSGFGTYEWMEGHRYHGCWKNNSSHGVGHYVTAMKVSPKLVEHTTYHCEFRDGLQYGFGFVENEAHGSVFAGEVKEIPENSSLNTMENRVVWGEISYTSGLKYMGDCVDSIKHGYGTLVFDKVVPDDLDETLFDASDEEMEDILRDLQSRYWDMMSISPFDFSSMSSETMVEDVLLEMSGEFIGHFQDDLPHGKGVFRLANGQQYDIEYRRGVIVRR